MTKQEFEEYKAKLKKNGEISVDEVRAKEVRITPHQDQPVDLVITMEGRPVPWARTNTYMGRRLTPEKQRKHQKDMARTIHNAAREVGIEKKITGPVEIVRAVFSYGKKPSTRIELRLHQADNGIIPNTATPDIDNLLKEFLEALELSGIIKNDSQVWRVAETMKVKI